MMRLLPTSSLRFPAYLLIGLTSLLFVACGGDEEQGEPDGMEDLQEMIEECPAEGAQIALAPRIFEFGPISSGTTEQKDLLVNNGGTGQACFNDPIITLEPVDAPFDVGPLIVGGDSADALNPGQTGRITFTFSPTAAVEGGMATVTVTTSNGNSDTINIRYSSTGSTVASIGTVAVDATIPFVLDGTRVDEPTYRDNTGGVVEEAVITGTFDDAPVPTTNAIVRAWAARQPDGGPDGASIELWQEQFATAPFEEPTINPGFTVVFPSDALQTGTQPLSLTAAEDQVTFLSTSVDAEGDTCATGIAAGSLTITDPMNTTDVDGGSFTVTGNATVYPLGATPEGDATAAAAALGFPECEGGPVAGPIYVRIDDAGPAGDQELSGADIDAIGVFRNGESLWAEEVIYYEHGAGLGDNLDPLDALASPDAFQNWPDLTSCDTSGGFLSLGGDGGILIVKMPVALQEGDSLQVLEVGDCDNGLGGAEPNPYTVFAGKSTNLNDQWIMLGSPAGGAETLSVPALSFEPDAP